MYNMKESGKRIAALRKGVNRTQEQVAEDLGIAVGTLSKIERGQRGCSVDMLDIFKEYYGVSVDYIMYGIESKKTAIIELISDLPESNQISAKNIIESILVNLS